MKAQLLLDLIRQGKQPTVRLTNNIWDDSWGEKDMIATVLTATVDRHGCIKFDFDYMGHLGHNLALQSHGYYIWKDGVDTGRTGTAFEADILDENNVHETVYWEPEDEMEIEFVEENTPLSEYVSSGSTMPYVSWLEMKLREARKA
jgi:hypothetical protein